MAHQIGFVGLGKMGKNMVLHLLEQGVEVAAYNRTKEVTEVFEKELLATRDSRVASDNANIANNELPVTNNQKKLSKNFHAVYDLRSLVSQIAAPRVVWLMVPNGKPIDEILEQLLAAGVTSGDTIIDGGNTYYKDTVRRAGELKSKGVNYVDCGTSGGLDGARHGACLMLGGDEKVVASLSWLWDALASQGETLRSWNYFGPSGAGHFVKMVHNGIEYGVDEALGEGIEILAKAPYELDLAKIVATWQNGSIIRSYLTELLGRALAKDPQLTSVTGHVGSGETGGWTLAAAREFGVEAPVLENSLAARQKSLATPTTSSKVVSALRKEYGGHDEAKGV